MTRFQHSHFFTFSSFLVRTSNIVRSVLKSLTIAVILITAAGCDLSKLIEGFDRAVAPPPDPVVIDSKGDDSASSLFDYKAKVTAQIYNQGGPGDVVVYCEVYQGDNSVSKKSITIHMKENEYQSVEFIISEVSLFGGDKKFLVTAYAK